MKDYFKLSFILFFICFISAFLLSFVNSKTLPIKEKILSDKEYKAKKEVFEEAVKFLEPVKYKDIEIYLCLDKNEKEIGAIIKAAPSGFSGNIIILFGINLNGNITGLKVISHTETPGLGSKMEEINKKKSEELFKKNNLIKKDKPWFQEQFKNFNYNDLIVDKDGGKIDSLTAATISSRAVCNGIRNAAKKFFDWYKNKNNVNNNIDKKEEEIDAQSSATKK